MLRKLFTVAVAASVIYLSPALFNPAALGHPQLWILIAAAVAISVFQPAYKPINSGAPERDHGTAAQIVWSVYLTQFAGSIEAVLFRYPESLRWDGVATAGLVFMAAGLALRVWSVLTLGRYFTWFVSVHDDHKVIRSGPFRYIRHPAYGGALILFVATMVFIHAWVAVGLSLVFQLFAYLRRIRHEEALMVERLGESYVEYRREVRALIPLVW